MKAWFIELALFAKEHWHGGPARNAHHAGVAEYPHHWREISYCALIHVIHSCQLRKSIELIMFEFEC